MMRKKKKKAADSKTKGQRIHAKKRASERYGLKINREIIKQCIQMIQNGEAKFLCKSSNTRTLFELTLEGKRVKVVYDKVRKNIATFLPEKIKEVPNEDERSYPTATGS